MAFEIKMLKEQDYSCDILQYLKDGPLYATGCEDLLTKRAIGICGSRDASPRALKWARHFGMEAAKHGFVVVSGYARGVDREAHKGALEAGGATIAVLPEGIRHFRLVTELKPLVDLTKNFLAISMFEPDARWQSWRAMTRNKLIVGLSIGVFVVEARERGGTIDAAREAVRQKKRLWAVGYPKDSEQGRGNQLLIGTSAMPVWSSKDVDRALEEAMQEPPKAMEQLVFTLLHDKTSFENESETNGHAT